MVHADTRTNCDSGSHADVIRPFAASLPMALLQARESAMRLFRPMLADHGLTEQQWRVLRALAANDDAQLHAPQLEVGEIADATFLLGPSLSRILANLSERELIQRQPVAQDARRVAISLTTTGHELVSQVAPHSERIYAAIEGAFGAPELEQLIARLGELRDDVRGLS